MNVDLGAYRKHNSDLSAKSDEELLKHFEVHGQFEKRVFAYCNSTVERFSMKWCRGAGLEIGAGRNPMPLFGDATCVQADVIGGEYFGNSGFVIYSLNDELPRKFKSKFDFVTASHVLEHVDSLILSIKRMAQSVRRGGIIYAVVPDKSHTDDNHWLPDFDL